METKNNADKSEILELNFYKELIKKSPDGVHIIDTQGHLIYCSEKFASQLGYTYEEALTLNVRDWDVTFPEYQIEPTIKNLIEKPAVFNTKHTTKRGEVIDVQVNATSLQLEDKYYLYASAREIVDEIKLQNDLEVREKEFNQLNIRFEKILDNLTDGVVVQGSDGKIIEFNSRALEILSLTKDQLLGRDYFDPSWKSIKKDGSPFPGEEHPAMLALKNKKPVQNVIMGIMSGTNNLRWLKVNSIPVEDKGTVLSVSTFTDITRELENEKLLEESNSKYYESARTLENVLAHIPNQVFWKDRDLVYKGCNQMFADIVGLKNSKDIVGKTDYDFARDSEHASSYREWDSQVMDAGEPVIDLEERFHDANGNEGYVLTSKVPLKDDEGNVTGLLGICTDITHRVRTEKELEREKSRYDLAVKGVGVGIWEWDVVTNENIWSDTFYRLLGFEPGEIPASFGEWDSRLHPEDREGVHNALNAHLEENKPYDVKFRLRRKDNQYIWFRVSGKATFNDKGEPIMMAGSLENIHNHVLVEIQLQNEREKLEASEKFHRNIIEHIPFGMHMYQLNEEHELIFIDSNPAADKILGIDNQQFVGKKMVDAFPNIVETDVPKRFTEIAKNGGYWEKEDLAYQDGNLAGVFVNYNFQSAPNQVISLFRNVTEEKKNEIELKVSESRFRALAEFAPVMINSFNDEGECVLWNKECETTLGYTFKEVQEWDDTLSLFYPDEEVKQRVISSINNKNGQFAEYTVRTREGRLNQQMWANFELPDGSVIGFGYDVTQLRESENKLEENRQLLQSVINSAPCLIAYTDEENIFRIVNSQHEEATGIKPEDLLGVHLKDHLGEEVYLKMQPMLEQIKSGQIIETEKPIPHPSGEEHIYKGIFAPHYEDGKWKGIIRINLDITEQKRIQNELQEQELQMRTILNTLPDGVITIDQEANIQMFNPSAERLFGFKADEVIGKNINILMPEPYHSQHDSYIQKYLQTGENKVIGLSREVVGLRKDGTSFPMYLSVGEMESQGQKMFTGIGHDLTEIYLAKEKAEVANKAKSEFLANMSHEIRTPMNSVIGFSDLLSALINDKKQKSYIESIQTAGRSLLKLINDILDLSKVEAGRLEIQYEKISIRFFFQEIEQIFKVKIEEKQLQLLLEIDSEIPEFLRIDEVRLRQVLINLVGNAVKFTERGHIKIRVKTKDKTENHDKINLIIEVEDTGIGIPQDQHELIFESFRQQDGQSIRKYGGTGLGLSLTKKLVELMNGRISVKSAPNEGSCFAIQLLSVDVPSNVPIEIRKKEAFTPQRFRFEEGLVLVVDDIESNRRLITESLSQMGLEFVEADNGKNALLFADEFSPDVILMDIRMPIMDGYEATQKLRNNPNTTDIPVIAITASVSKGDISTIKELGFDGYLSKPVNLHALLLELSKYLRCENISETTESPEEKGEQDFSDEHWNVPPEIMEQLENKFQKEWETVKNYGVFNNIEVFGTQLLQLGNDNDIPPLSKFGETLTSQSESFDIEGLNRTLASYPKLLERLRSKLL